MKNWSYLSIITGAALWGILGIFVKALADIGFTPMDIVTLRMLSAAIIMVFYALFMDRGLLNISFKDIKYFIGTGIFSIAFFSWCYFTAMRETSLTVAVILLYTAPAFVTIISRILYKEYLTKRKIIALSITLIGTIMVIGYTPGGNNISLYGLIVGLASGLGYALYSVFGKAALSKYKTLTVTTYSFIVASIAILPFSNLLQIREEYYFAGTWLYILGLGSIPTALAYILYTKGLEKVESSRASITATIEPVMATLVGVVIYGERLSLFQGLGVFMILSALLLVQEKTSSKVSVEAVQASNIFKSPLI